ncbi:DUF2806 domain-containing protein [Pseudomonas sp. IT-P395]|uniref:DUF2806 domain-containing protein n=1 Tax=Pseudomonas sp. IT-P395 TaxID=3026459 RepID=UPI0039E104FD
MADGLSLIDLKGVSEPLTKLIESVSKGIGALYEPTGKVRNAKAEAKAMLILAKAGEKVDSVTLRALERVSHQEIRRQNNIDAIVKGAVEYLPGEVSSEEVNEDWVVNFFNLGQDIGNAQMQKIWSRLLAGEVAQPGSFKSRTVQAVKSLSVDDANLFTLLCEFSFVTDGDERVFPVFSHEFFNYVRANGLSTKAETHLQSIGLLNSGVIWYGATRSEDKIYLRYFSENYYTSPKPSKKTVNKVFMQAFPFTEIGRELANIAGGRPNKEYINLLRRDGCIYPVEEN